jgi:hypothetical protein
MLTRKGGVRLYSCGEASDTCENVANAIFQAISNCQEEINGVWRAGANWPYPNSAAGDGTVINNDPAYIQLSQ